KDAARENVSACVGQVAAVEIGFLDKSIEGAVRLAKGDAKTPRLLHRMAEYAGRTTRQFRQIGGAEEIVAVERQELLRTEMLPTGKQGVAGAARRFLAHHLPVGEMGLLAQIRFNLLVQVVDDDQYPIDSL